MAEDTERFPMDDMAQTPPPSEPEQQAPEQTQEQRERDDQGRFAPRSDQQQREPRGRPDAEAARRREAQERDHWKTEAENSKKAHEALQKRLDDMAAFAAGKDPNAPDPPADPLAPVLEKINSIDQRLTQRDQQAQQEQEWNQVRTYADQDEATFRQQQPDFPDAVSHYISSRLTEMQALGISQEQAEGLLQQEAQQLLMESARGGRSPAQTIYAMAKARGYQGAASQQTVTQRQPFEAAQPPRPAGGRSLGTGSGPAGGAMTAAQIAAMDEADYMAFRATPEGKRAIQRAMGG